MRVEGDGRAVARRLAELAEQVGGRVVGDPSRAVAAIRTLESAGPEDLSFLTDPGRYRRRAVESRAGVLLVGEASAGDAELAAGGRELLVAPDPARALAELLALFYPRRAPEAGVHPTAVVAEGARVDPTAAVGPYAVVGAGSRIEAGAAVGAHAVVGRDCRLGSGAVLHPHVVLYDGTEVGEGSVVHAGTVLGADGFGYVSRDGVHHKVPQVGRAVVGAGVEIGANSAVDRATLGETSIGAGTKIDNLVQVGHNVRVGRASILCGQAGIAGSSHLGDGVVLAGQAGVGGHLELGDGVQVAAKSAALKSLPAGAKVAGVPAVEIGKWRRQVVLTARLGELARRVEALERKLAADEEE